MKSTERQRVIVERLKAVPRVGVAELVAATGASDMTIRRDLDYLAAQGVLKRVHGGAVPAMPTGIEPPFAARATAALGPKQAIARAAAEHIRDGDTIVLDSGTTALEVARLLHNRTVTVMPLSLHVAQELVDAPGVRLLMPGGEPRPGELAMVGPLTLASLRALRFDIAVLSPCAFSIEAGMTAFDLGDAEVKQQALAVSTRAIVLADGAKWDRTALAYICPADRPDLIITDSTAPEDTRAVLAQRGVLIQVADQSAIDQSATDQSRTDRPVAARPALEGSS
ncbi:DeoR/GlpR family DNA-binding transcription regulator [Kribbella sp. VKM Ac-2568]|uniref:DeoR/GlpR family DNA-binding transcription regulator n=1 Tax=Kribbella sp. VKM Ac-2568 TaxID=2512219 RepID=UPI00104BC434|nr:DeoR/GlpR family DNA-binding transcription regulator [Kribbella sp. VKM Ac-2568]TCM41063.1 DeoR family transcriptional regulator [Kribbella sp. VKM Ac-2568]